MKRTSASALISLLLIVAVARADVPTTSPTTAPATDLFDPARHMRVREVRPGMKGYGLSVFKGTKIERFDVEVLSVLRNFNTKYDVVLVALKGANLEHTGSIAGMSGSPIYLRDEAGKERMIGAFAYGWPLMKDPVGGVQPIEYMLRIEPRATSSATQPAASAGKQWDVGEVALLPGMSAPPVNYPFRSRNSFAVNPCLAVAEPDATRLRPLMTPLMTSGVPTRLLDQLAPVFAAYGFVPLQAGGSSTNPTDAKLEPGSVLAVPLLTGDMELAAVGTCTDVVGERVFGFGHPFNNEGPVALPLTGGEIHGVIANLMTSFKLGAAGKPRGTLFADEQVGVAGMLGDSPVMIPIDLEVRNSDGSGSRKYSFKSAWHSRFTPLISATALAAAVTSVHDLPEYNTLDYDATIEFANGEKIKLANSLVNSSMPELFFEFGMPMIVAASNPFERVSVSKISGVVTITPEARDAAILWVNTPRLKFRAGETLKASVTYRRFRAGDAILPIEFELPRDLSEGTYQFSVSGWEEYLMQERAAKPFRFAAESAKDVFSVIRELTSFRHDAVYMRLQRQPDGIAIGRTAMPSLPSSRREVLIGAGRSNTTPFVSSTTKIVRTDFLMSGAAQFEITIDKNAHVETGVGRSPTRHDATPPAGASPKPTDEPKVKPAKPDAPTPPEKSPVEPPA